MNISPGRRSTISTQWVIGPGCVVEQVGAEFVVLCPSASVAYRMTGLAAEVVGHVRSGGGVVPDHLRAAAVELAATGIIAPAVGTMGASLGAGVTGIQLSRRAALRLGGAAAAVGVVALALPSAAAAASIAGPQVSVTGSPVVTTQLYGAEYWREYLYMANGSFAFTSDEPDEMYIGIVGGGGGGGGYFGGGGGGAGHEVFPALMPLLEVSYDIVVGAGGIGGDAFGGPPPPADNPGDGRSGASSVVREFFNGAVEATWTALGGRGGGYFQGRGGDSVGDFTGGAGAGGAGGGGGGSSSLGGDATAGNGGTGGLGSAVRVDGVESREVGAGGGGGGEFNGGQTVGTVGGGVGGSIGVAPQDGQWGSGGGGGGFGTPDFGLDPTYTAGAAGGSGFVVISFPVGDPA